MGGHETLRITGHDGAPQTRIGEALLAAIERGGEEKQKKERKKKKKTDRRVLLYTIMCMYMYM